MSTNDDEIGRAAMLAARAQERDRLPYPRHAERIVPIGDNPSIILYRIAVARSAAADRRHEEFRLSGRRERQLREAEFCIEVLLLTQAALEGWMNWLLLTNEVTIKGSWIKRWEDGPTIVALKLGHPAPQPLGELRKSALLRLGAWRNFLMHGSSKARVTLLTERGLGPEVDIQDLLSAELGRQTIVDADDVFTYGGASTASGAPYSDEMWVAHDER